MKTQFTQYLRAWRDANDRTATQAAIAADVSENTWRQYEHGAAPGAVGLEKLAALFGCESAVLAAMVQRTCDPDIFRAAMCAALHGELQRLAA